MPRDEWDEFHDLEEFVVAQTLVVVVTEHGGTDGAARPVAASHILASAERAAIQLGAGEDVVHVGFVSARVDGLVLLAERGLPVELIVVAA